MPKTTLVLQDYCNCKFVGLDPLTRKKFNESLKFMVPHARHTPQFKLKRWDGKVSFGGLGGTTFINLLELVLPLITDAGYDIEIDDQRVDHNIVLPEIDEEYVADRFWPTGHVMAGEPIILRDYQVDAINRFFKNQNSIQSIATGAGKAQPLNAKIKIPNGWTTMGEVSIGTVVSTPDGTKANIIGIYPQGEKNIYRITFKDGRFADACADHLWMVYNNGWDVVSKRGNSPYQILTTLQIQERLAKFDERLRIDLINPLKSNDSDIVLPLDPYVLGVLLGDGCLSYKKVEFASADEFIVNKISEKLVDGYVVKKCYNKYGYVIAMVDAPPVAGAAKGTVFHHYKKVLKELGLWGTNSSTKFIPSVYLNASHSQKMELIQGMLDTDGSANIKGGSVSYSTNSTQLRDGLIELIRSVGGSAHFREVKTNNISYCINIRHPLRRNLFSLPRKMDRIPENLPWTLRLEIKSVELITRSQSQCIMIDHPDHLYITDNYVVTHNTIVTGCLSLSVEPYGRSITIVPSKDLIKQTESDYRNLGLDVGTFYGDRKQIGHKHTICTWQSLTVFDKKSKQYDIDFPIEEFLQDVICVIIDEAHSVKGTLLKELLCGSMAHIPIRWGLTGTVPKEDFEFMSLLASIGPVVGEIKASYLQERDVLSGCDIEVLQLQEDHVEFTDWESENNFLSTDNDRLEWVSSYCKTLSESGNTLILVDRRATGFALEKLIKDSVFLYGETKSDDRSKEYKQIQTSNNKIIIATYGIAAVGINVPRLFNLVLYSCGKSYTRVIQSIGRLLRKANDKDHANIKDLTSTLKFSRRHLVKRKEYYKEAGYPFRTTKIKYK